MRSSFFEFHVAISGVSTARANLEVLSHNTANAAIKGYSRQVPQQRADYPLPLNNGKGMVGTGSKVYEVIQMRDIFLDNKYWAQKSVLGEFTGKSTYLSMLETIFNEMGDNMGISSAITDFFAKSSDLSTTANDATYRTNLIQSAGSMAQLVNSYGKLLHKQQSDANIELSILVEQINSIGMQIVSLNKKILQHEMAGDHANDLRDQRARLVDELSDLVNVEARELDLGTDLNPNRKHYIVMLNGYDFINHYDMNTLGVVPRQPGDEHNYMDVEGLFDLAFTNNNVEFDIYHPRLRGQLKGVIDIRDGNGASANALQPTIDYKGIPFYMEKLNRFVRNLGMAIDQGRYLDGTSISTSTQIPGIIGHANGYDLNGEALGTLMFTYEGGPTEIDLPAMDNFYDDMNCLNFIANPVLLSDPRRINCAPDPLQGESAHAVTLGFATIFNDPSLFREGRIKDFVTALNSVLGIDARQASNFEASYSDMTTAIDNQRINVSGVDLNEEMVNMIKNQQLYQASAKLVSTINNIYDVLINRLGA